MFRNSHAADSLNQSDDGAGFAALNRSGYEEGESEVGLSRSRRGFLPPPNFYHATPQEAPLIGYPPVLIDSELLMDVPSSQMRSKKLRSPFLLNNLQKSHQAPEPRHSVGQEGSVGLIRKFERSPHQLSEHGSRASSQESIDQSMTQQPIAFMRKIETPPTHNPLLQGYVQQSTSTSNQLFDPNAQHHDHRRQPHDSNNALNESLIHAVSEDSSLVVEDSRVESRALQYRQECRPVPSLLSNNYQPSNRSSTRSRGFVDRETSRMIMDMSQGKLIPEDQTGRNSQIHQEPRILGRNHLFNGVETNSYHHSTSRHSALEFMGVNPEPIRFGGLQESRQILKPELRSSQF